MASSALGTEATLPDKAYKEWISSVFFSNHIPHSIPLTHVFFCSPETLSSFPILGLHSVSSSPSWLLITHQVVASKAFSERSFLSTPHTWTLFSLLSFYQPSQFALRIRLSTTCQSFFLSWIAYVAFLHH